MKRSIKKENVDKAIQKLECLDGFLQRMQSHGDNIQHAAHYQRIANDLKFLVLQIGQEGRK